MPKPGSSAQLMVEREGSEIWRDLYHVQREVVFSAVNERQLVSINVPTDADFVWVKGVYSSSVAAATLALIKGGSVIGVTDQGSQRALTDGQVPIGTLFALLGLGFDPVLVPWVHRFRRNGTISLDITNLVSGAQTVHVVLMGYKIFKDSDRL